MRDPATGAMILGLAQQQAQQWQNIAAQQPGQNSGDAYSYSAGLVNGFFDAQAQTVYKSLGNNGSGWQNQLVQHAGDIVDISVDVVADPGAAAKTITIDLTDVIIKQAVTNALPAGGSAAPPPNYSSWQGAYANQVTADFNSATPQLMQGNPALSALVASTQNYDGGSFVKGGKIIDPGTMSRQQLQAYNAWLSSPTAINYVQNGGQSTSYNDGYNSWYIQAYMHSSG
jgi:hypothetical protein